RDFGNAGVGVRNWTDGDVQQERQPREWRSEHCVIPQPLGILADSPPQWHTKSALVRRTVQNVSQCDVRATSSIGTFQQRTTVISRSPSTAGTVTRSELQAS